MMSRGSFVTGTSESRAITGKRNMLVAQVMTRQRHI